MNNRTTPRFITAVVWVACAPAAPAQTAREGPVDTTLCWGGPMHVVVVSADERFGTFTITGASRAADKAFDAMSIECVGTFELRSGAYRHKGYCVFVDPAGDRIWGTDAVDAQGYTWLFLGGSGKFQGISGSGQVERLGPARYVREGTVQGCRRLVGNYKLP